MTYLTLNHADPHTHRVKPERVSAFLFIRLVFHHAAACAHKVNAAVCVHEVMANNFIQAAGKFLPAKSCFIE